jgi:plasmid stabilization system protein ParE
VYSIIFTQAARAELIDAQDWYEGEAAGPARRFRQAIVAVIERMSDNPRQFPPDLKTCAAPSCAAFRIRFSSSLMTRLLP